MFNKKIKKLVITGGAGYIGNTLIMSLPKSIEIVVIDNFVIDTVHKRRINKELSQSKNVTLVKANVSEVTKYQKHLKNVDAVVYMASLNSYQEANSDPMLYLTENNLHLQLFLSTLKIQSPKVNKIILTSSRGVYGEGTYKCLDCKVKFNPDMSEDIKCIKCEKTNVTPEDILESDPTNPSSYYGLSKQFQEDILKMHCKLNNIQLDIFRIFNVYGEDQGKYYSNIGIIPRIYAQILSKGQNYLAGKGALSRDFIHINDVVDVICASLYSITKRKNLVEVNNLGSGQSISISDIARFFELKGYKFKKNYLKEYGDVKHSNANNLKLKNRFEVRKFVDIYYFLSNTYRNVDQSRHYEI